METTWVSIDRWVDNKNEIYMEYYAVLYNHQKDGCIAICSSVNWPGEHYAKWNKSGKDKSSCPTVSTEDWIQDPLNILKSRGP